MQYYWWKLTFAVGGNVYTIGQGWATYGPWGDFDPPADCIQPYSVTRPEAPFLTSNCLSAIAGNYVTAESVVNISHYCHDRLQPTLKKCRMLYNRNWLICSVTLPSKRNSDLKVLTNLCITEYIQVCQLEKDGHETTRSIWVHIYLWTNIFDNEH